MRTEVRSNLVVLINLQPKQNIEQELSISWQQIYAQRLGLECKSNIKSLFLIELSDFTLINSLGPILVVIDYCSYNDIL